MAEKNRIYPTILRGAGAYRHFIPAVVKSVVTREELVTAYTPYQAEISQGILQSIFEFQTMICMLTGMDVANASVYDGGTAAAESIAMCKDRKRTKACLLYTSSGALRMGVNEMTRFGFEKEDFAKLASIMADCILRGRNVVEDVAKLRAEHRELRYCFNDDQINAAVESFAKRTGM